MTATPASRPASARSVSIAVIGAGNMGLPIARHISARFPDLVVIDTNEDRVDLARESGLIAYSDVDELRDIPIDVVVTSLGHPDLLRSVLVGTASVLTGRESGCTVLDVGTSGYEASIALFEALRENGHRFVDSPLSGGRQGAEAGTLTAMVGATEGELAVVAGILSTFCATVHYMGAIGRGATIKLANNALAIGSLALAGEVLAYTEARGLDRQATLETIAASTGDSRMLRLKHAMLLDGEYTKPNFDIQLALKDVDLILHAAEADDLSLPILALTVDLLRRVAQSTTEPLDVSAICEPAIRKAMAARG